jgi:hypothetical protein
MSTRASVALLVVGGCGADAARPSILRYTLLGLALVPLSLGLTLLTVTTV